MTPRGAVPVSWRLPVLAAAGVALVGGLYAALVLLEPAVPDPTGTTGEVHGPVMALGFVGISIVGFVGCAAAMAVRARHRGAAAAGTSTRRPPSTVAVGR